jgi:xylitol oxidase
MVVPIGGKVCPLTAGEASRLYDRLPEFREICDEYDPAGVFRNEWVNRVLFTEETNRA